MSWNEAFDAHTFTEQHVKLMDNFHIKYECLDARDDYHAQLAKGGSDVFLSSWDNGESNESSDFCDPIAIPEDTTFDESDVPSFLQKDGKAYKERQKQHLRIRSILASVGWIAESKTGSVVTESIKLAIARSGAEWKAETVKYRQSLLESRKHALHSTEGVPSSSKEASNVVKIVEESIAKYCLNREQERAFCIIANHASNPHPALLKMYIGGMGGTGKSQVLKALSHFFELCQEAHWFVIVAPTGSAAALLGGSTYHYMFGINDHSGTLSNFAQV